MLGSRRPRGAAGITLIEVLIGIVIVGLIAVAISAISLTAVITIKDDSQERQQEATTAQWSSLTFARDVQGASSLVSACGSGGTHLLTLQASDSAEKVEYRSVPTGAGTFGLTRTVCGSSGRTVVGDLHIAPTVTCAQADGTAVACAPGTAPRRITLAISRTSAFAFELDGARRLTDGNSTAPPLEVPTFVSLGGDTPFEAGGTSQLQVVGNALINRPTSGAAAVRLSGGPASPGNPASYRLRVSGDFELQTGATCDGCPTRSDKQPGTYQTRLLDPLRFLPVPDQSTMSTRTNCPVQSGVRICEPGIYPTEFPPAVGGGGVKDFKLLPGIYVLQAGMKVTNGSVVGSDVLIYNETGNVKVTGADIDLRPPSTGTYSGILFFQARSNSQVFEIVGNAQLASLTGTIYAPSSTNVVLGGGGGELRVGRVIGQNLETSGGGTVIVDGS
ncbi:PulJ/GspJ family protein [Dermatobacter hominis]|uniref:PulJ/GspJ family protein n=1 Tax=Dermatobacter hominis TaxID=2884263 RepID=UPI001D11770E|nr:type II secretion system protein [Dermatobacter hominis]UDY37312.1 type II secretion system GspH family protein [Dermatobacter hominis]